ncbi:hypothetical protein [Bradyrhizobium sp. CB1015]|nr:hypothetical protein [Bradyrhizobium sp. CB1015]UWU95697.1 hypothetical protein N2604_18210 [Bradyrhizobium sp. CB1015]
MFAAAAKMSENIADVTADVARQEQSSPSEQQESRKVGHRRVFSKLIY